MLPFLIALPLGQPHNVFEVWHSVRYIFVCPNNGMAASALDL